MKKILVINLMYLGDLLFMTPLLRLLRFNYPNAKIDLLIDKKSQEVVLYNPNVSEFIAIDKKGYHNKLLNYTRLILDVQQRKYDLVVNLHLSERASAIAAFSRSKKIVGYCAKGFRMFFDKVVHRRTDVHQVDAYLEIGKHLGLQQINNYFLEMQVDAQSRNNAEILWEAEGLQEKTKVIGLNTGGSWPTKRWTVEGFVDLGDMLQQSGYRVAFFGGHMDEQMVEDIAQRMKTIPVIFTGRVTLLELAVMVRKCGAFVSGDSGPMHIATSQGVPIIAIYGPSDPVRYAPYNVEHRIIKSQMDCLTCGEHECGHHRCMKNISPAVVFSAVEEIIER
jgi:lipopolysaccharide heptosyltransferase II